MASMRTSGIDTIINDLKSLERIDGDSERLKMQAIAYAELETLMREIRFALCESLGESGGMNLYDEIIRLSRLDERQRCEYCAEKISKAERGNPEMAKMASDLTDELMLRIFGVTTEGKKNGKY